MPNPDFDFLQSIFPVSHETFERLLTYQKMLHKWQNSLNLVSKNTLSESWERHFIDSIQIAPLIKINNPTIVDLGSGAGFPGLVLSILGMGQIHLVESDKKKCIFLKEVSRETNATLEIHNDRIENLSIPKVDIITSRACSDVSQLFHWSKNFVSHETKCLFHKGKNYSIEFERAKLDWEFDSTIHQSIVDSESYILEIRHINRRELHERKPEKKP